LKTALEAAPKKKVSFATREKRRMKEEFSALLDFILQRGGHRHVEGEMQLDLVLPVNVANARLHWRSKDTLRQAYFAHCDMLLRTGAIPRPLSTPIPCASIRVEMHCKREMDTDNAVARCKWAGDWLQERGYIMSDKPSGLKWEGMPQQFPKSKSPRLVIYLREVSP
jgi:hypothetical protein